MDFQKWLDNCELIDIDYAGGNFTWCNNRSPKKKIWKRLDRVCINDL